MLRRRFLLAFVPALAAAQLKERPAGAPDSTSPDSTKGMVDEDEDLVQQTEYAFNPIQAQNEVKIGDFYAKKNSYRAAAGRYLEATKWFPQFAEAYWKLGIARDKLNQPAEALEAYRTYLSLEADGKFAKKASKRVEEISATMEKLPMAAAESEER